MTLRTLSFVFAVFGLLTLSAIPLTGVDYGYPPPGKYLTIETAHFRLHYPQTINSSITQRLIKKFEHCHTELTRRIPWTPDEPCDVILVDAMDSHNGWATPLPRNTISLFLADSPSDGELLDPGDYLVRTFIHEYIHILTLDMTTGYRQTARSVFGKSAYLGPDLLALLVNFFLVVPTNLLNGVWYVEGPTVYGETALTKTGRGRSAHYNALARLAVLSGKPLSIDQINPQTDQWPFGAISYFYGYQLARTLQERETNKDSVIWPIGETFLNTSNALPFFVNDGLEETAGITFSQLMALTNQAMADRQQPRIDALQASALTQLPRLTPFAARAGRPAVSLSDPRSVFLPFMPMDGRNRLYSVFLPDLSATTVLKSLDTVSPRHDVSLTADDQYLYYTSFNLYNKNLLYSDLYRHNAQTNKTERITTGARIRNASVSPDGKRIAFTRDVMAVQTVWVARVDALENGLFDHTSDRPIPPLRLSSVSETGAVLIDTASYGIQFYDPKFSTDGRRLVYSRADANGWALKIKSLESPDRPVVILSASDAMLLHPSFTVDDNALLFSSDKTGVFNAWKMTLPKNSGVQLNADWSAISPTPVSNAMGGVFYPTDDGAGRVVALGMDIDGYYLTRFAPTGLSATEIPVVGNDWSEGVSEIDLVSAPAPDVAVTESKPYAAWRYAAPQWWFPALSANEQTVGFGVVFGGSDPLGYYQYLVHAGVGQLPADPDVDGDVNRSLGLNGMLWIGLYAAEPDVSVKLSRDTVVFSNQLISLFNDEFDYVDVQTSIELNADFTFLTHDIWYGIGLTAAFESRRESDVGRERYENELLISAPVFIGDYFEFGMSAMIDTTTSYKRSVSSEDGWRLSGYYAIRNGDIEQRLYTLSVERYQSLVYRNTILYLRAATGGITGDNPAGLVWQAGGGKSGISVRGYEENVIEGARFLDLKAAVRLPVWNIQRGPGTIPIYLSSVSVEIFHDAASVFDSFNDIDGARSFIQSDGLELQLNSWFAQGVYLRFSAGYARAQDRPDDEKNNFYLDVNYSF